MSQFDKQTLDALGVKPAQEYMLSVQNTRRRLEEEHKMATEEAKGLRQRLHEVELIRTGCQAALTAMEAEEVDAEEMPYPNTREVFGRPE